MDQKINRKYKGGVKKAISIIGFLLLSLFFSISLLIFYNPSFLKTEVSLDKDKEVNFTEEIVLDFSHPAREENYKNLQIVPAEKFFYRWENSHKRLVIKPTNFWRPETTYTLSLPAGKTIFFSSIPVQEFSFDTIKFPRVKGVAPVDGEKDVVLDIEDPVVVDFTKSTKDFFIKFTINPFSQMTYENNPEKTQFKLLPLEKVKEGTNYEIKIYIKYIRDDDSGYKEIYTSHFETLPPPPAQWDKDFSLRLEQAERYTRPEIKTGKYIDINLTSQILTTFQDGALLTTSLISTGKRGMDTPKGTFHVMAKAKRPWSKKYSLYMPWFMQFTRDGHGIHELPEWPGGFKEGASHLGIPVSHGCVRLGIGPAKEVYEWAEVGTPIVIH